LGREPALPREGKGESRAARLRLTMRRIRESPVSQRFAGRKSASREIERERFIRHGQEEDIAARAIKELRPPPAARLMRTFTKELRRAHKSPRELSRRPPPPLPSFHPSVLHALTPSPLMAALAAAAAAGQISPASRDKSVRARGVICQRVSLLPSPPLLPICPASISSKGPKEKDSPRRKKSEE